MALFVRNMVRPGAAARNSLPVLLVILGHFAFIVSCLMDDSATFWRGRPQPIGIDFTSAGAYAVAAEKSGNFSVLGRAYPRDNNPYDRFVRNLYMHRGDAGYILIEDYHTGWFRETVNWASQKYIELQNDLFWECQRHLKPHSCSFFLPSPNKRPRRLSNWHAHRLLAKRRLRLLYAFVFPKSALSYTDQMPFTKSNMVLSVLDMLQELKHDVLQKHGMRLRSAVIASPTWLPDHRQNIFRDACFLANMECFEAWEDNVHMALKTAPHGSTVLVLDHGAYHLDLHYAACFDTRHGDCTPMIQDSLNIAGAGLLGVAKGMLGRIIGYYHGAANITQEEAVLSFPIPRESLDLDDAVDHILRVVHCGEWDCEGLAERGQDLTSIAANITLKQVGSSGKEATVTVNCQDVLVTRSWYLNQYSDYIQAFLSSPAISSYRSRHEPVYKHRSPREDLADRLHLIANTSPPGDSGGSWFRQVDHLIIMDDTGSSTLLYDAVVKATDWSVGAKRSNDRACDACIPGDSVAARGGALKALEWEEQWTSGHGHLSRQVQG